ncbi:hypothetical protein K461DRAFT_274660 [Myriangium duriaei CBS 260.36]|uniref:Nucleoporin Nup133/Nup155-like N-terminal domain-containing protein n=1 Tax=Myriangium duriaei CBS 260.36 TaxID=1168546 RepID=A0A9P4JAW3_9PEZI|nr:hypothetical protein K461DRAFT_274660 [Myriangium duriaei CBS 260.36]
MSLQSGGRESSRRVSARNPRRRQRLDTDSVGHQPRRKRSKVTSETFDGPTFTNGDTEQEHLANGYVEVRSRKSVTPNESLDIPVRSKKNVHKRATRGDGGAIMTQNAHYALRQLPSTPDVLRKSTSDFHGSILSHPPHALVVTREHAYIWDYTSSTPVAQPRVFDVPQHARYTDPVPLGQMLTNGASSSVGLVLVSATTGDVTYWENIDTAESLSLFQNQSTGVKGSIGGLFSGETIMDITNAEHAGIILTLSSGRIAQVSLRDAQGRPTVQAQFLKSKDGSSAGGLFSSLKGAFGVGWKRDIVGVRTRPQGSKGHIQVISATASAQVQVWELAWSGHSVHRETIDFRELLQAETDILDDSLPGKAPTPTLIDFAVLPTKSNGNEISLVGDETPIDLVFLTRRSSSYALVEVTLSGGKAYVERVTALKGYKALSQDERPRLTIPVPAHSAIITFPHAFAIAALSDDDTSGPDAQLFMEAHSAPKLFQDVVHLRENQHTSILAASAESADDRAQHSSTIFFVKGFGLARLSINKPTRDLKIPVKSRIEQAIFYGTQPQNIIDFQRIDHRAYSAEEAEEAALQISQDILASEPPFMSTSLPSIEAQINSREDASLALIAYLQRHFSPVSRVTSWKLLTDSEKLAAGLELWKAFDSAISDHNSPRPSVLPAVIKVIRSKTRGAKISKDSELDEVRHWFMHDLRHLDQLYLQSLSLVNNGYQSGSLHNLTKLLSECDDIIFRVFETVFEFRTSSARTYGIDASSIDEGVLESGWEDLPEPWTATHESLNSLDHYVDIARNYMVDLYEKPDTERDADDQYVGKIVRENVQLVQILCRCYRERIGWCSSHYAEKYRHYAPSLQEKFKRSREHHLKGLVTIGQAGAGLTIAEQYKDMDSLVRLVMSETAYLVESKEDPAIGSDEKAVIKERMDELETRIKRFFRDYGKSFANPYFDSHLAGQRSFGLLKEESLFEEPLTEYLRAEGSRGRLGWINEVINTKDLNRAQVALQGLAKDHETKLWNKKVELSLSKLTAWAVEEKEATTGLANSSLSAAVSALDSQLSITAIQDALYSHLRPLIRISMDHDSEVQLVTDAHAVSIRTTLPALHQLLEITFDDLLRHTALSAEQLVDVLTLMDFAPSHDPEVDLAGQEFYLALKVLDAARVDMDDARFQTVLRTIWKRCYLLDEWDLIQKTSGKSESQIAERLRQTRTAETISYGLADGKTLCLPKGEPVADFL